MNKVMELREKRAKLWEQTKDFLEQHTGADGKLSAEEAASYDKMIDEIQELTKTIDRFDKQAALDAEFSKATTQPLINQPAGEMKTGRASDTYKKATLSLLRSNFRKVSDVLEEGVDANGGYLVPDEYDDRIVDILESENVIRRFATVITTSGERKINVAADKPTASWTAEKGALTFTDAKFGQVSLDSYKLTTAIKVTEELLADNAFNLEDYVIEAFGKAIASAEEDAFLNGDGNGKPTGLLTRATVGVEAATANITADNIIDLIYKLKRPYRKNAKFVVNDQTMAMIRKMKDTSGQFLWQPSLIASEPDRLFGYEIYTSEYMPIAEPGAIPILFGDISYYKIADRGTRILQKLIELYAGEGMVAFVMKQRVDGILTLPESCQVIKIKGGS